MKYERLTPKYLIQVANINDNENLEPLLRYAIRLHELENKIEKGILKEVEEV